MPIRDLIIVGMVVYSIPHIFKKPWIGVLVWFWISLMNPHRLCWGFAYNMPLAQTAAIALLVSLLLTKEKFNPPKHSIMFFWVLFVVWMIVSAVTAIYPELATRELERCLKIQLMTVPLLLVITDRERITALAATIALSIGFFGIKGGVFAIRSGMQGVVWGPPDSFITGNNEVGLAILIVIPLLRFLQLQSEVRWQKRALSLAIFLCFMSVLSTYSRGAFLAMGVMASVMILKSRNRAVFAIVIIIALPIVFTMLPQKWFDRMGTIQSYEQDGSAQGRINAWYMAYNLAKARPLTGGGFGAFNRITFAQYAPNPHDFHDAHSIYFEVLGEMGFVGLFLFLTIFGLSFRLAGKTAKKSARQSGTALGC